MKNQIDSIPEVPGKTISACHISDDCALLLLSFTDGAFIGFTRNRSYGDSCDDRIEVLSISRDNIPDRDLVAIGLMSAEDLAEKERKLRDYSRSISERRQREEYERLKAKFEGASAEVT